MVTRRTPPARDIAQSGACLLPACLLTGWRMWSSVAFTQAVAAQQKDFGVFHDAIGDGGGDSGVVEDVAPVGKCRVGRDERGALVAVAGRDDLIKRFEVCWSSDRQPSSSTMRSALSRGLWQAGIQRPRNNCGRFTIGEGGMGSLKNLARAIREMDRVVVYDNSAPGQRPKRMLVAEHGRVIWCDPVCSQWLHGALPPPK